MNFLERFNCQVMGNKLWLARQRKIRINGFIIDASQMTLANWIFQHYPETATNVKLQNHELRTTYMHLLFGIIETLYHTPLRTLSEDELSKATKDVADLTQAGFKLEWLESKLAKISLEKKTSEDRVVELKEEVKKLVQTVSDLNRERKKEKAKLKKKPCWIEIKLKD
ncbi:unnamed protein product [Microthlaspi erraticum]|uniref:MATH domain-containing protein n=1 Tax=Microthlaspi erraticum TaxID=1685480 RepID=A0A6D2IU25_9BRAS|nr:unnamed protein product [Microthlaspi erraticum]